MVASAGADKPRFRQDLVAEPVEDGATRFIDVADPDTGNLFRFYEVEYSLACAMDGERDVAGIVQWAKEELGLQASAKEVQIVISTLRDLGYLESGAGAAAAARPVAAAPVETPRPAAAPAGVKPSQKPAVNKWDQPTAMGDADEYLEPGVVVAKGTGARAPAADDVELGSAGAHAPTIETDLPKAADLELGAPGATPAPASRPPVPKTSDIPLGHAGKSDVSIDLADHMAVGAEDVKEAVRASQVMKAVDVPKELLESVEPTVTTSPESKAEAKKPLSKAEQRAADKAERIEKQRAEAAKAEAKAEDKAEPKVEAKPEPKPEPKVEKKPEPKVEKKPEPRAEAKAKPAVEAPKKAPPEEKRPVVPPAPSGGTSPVLIALLVIAVLAAAGFFAWKFLLKKETKSEPGATTQPVQPKPPEPPPPPPVESQKLATEQQDAVDLKATVAGTLETVATADTQVKTGDTIAQLAGHKPLETEIAAMQRDIDTRVKPELDKAEKDRDAAQTAGNKAALTAAEARIADRKKSLEDKQAKIAAKQADLAKLQIKSPGEGKLTSVAKASSKVAAGDTVAKLVRAPVLTATFKTASGVTPQQRILLSPKGSEQKLSCTVVTADASGVKVACPADASTEGTEVTFVGPDPNAPAAQGSGEIEMNDEGSAGSTAPAAGSAAAGSAAAPAGTPADKADKAATPPADKAATPPANKAATPAKAPARSAHAPAHAPAKPAGSATAPADKPADTTPPAAPAEKPAEAPAPSASGDTLK